MVYYVAPPTGFEDGRIFTAASHRNSLANQLLTSSIQRSTDRRRTIAVSHMPISDIEWQAYQHPLQLQITTLLGQGQVRLGARARERLNFVIWAVLLSGTVVQRQAARHLASILPNGASTSSHERRVRRSIADARLNWQEVFAPLVRYLLPNLTGSVTLIVDESGHSDVVRALTAALWYQGRAIPLAWIVWKGQTPHETKYWDDCQTLLDRVALVLPEGRATLCQFRIERNRTVASLSCPP